VVAATERKAATLSLGSASGERTYAHRRRRRPEARAKPKKQHPHGAQLVPQLVAQIRFAFRRPSLREEIGESVLSEMTNFAANLVNCRGFLQKILSWARSSMADTCRVLISGVCFCTRNTTICTFATQVARTCMNLHANDNFLYVWCNYLNCKLHPQITFNYQPSSHHGQHSAIISPF
jgi:hypothetical protein